MKLSLRLFPFILYATISHAGPMPYANPMTNCLNDNILPMMGKNVDDTQVINNAFLLCKPLIDSWLAGYASPAKRAQLYQQLRAYYIAQLQRPTQFSR